jgi:hypothetical protein
MRGLVLIVALAAGGCMHATSSSPSWPKDRTDGEGGESLAPREGAKSVAEVVEKDDDEKPAEAPAEKPAEKPAPVTEGGAPAAAAPAAPEDVIQTEEIVIEVGGDD